MYSLVNVAVVVRDLSRHQHGVALAADLLHVLALDDAALAELDALAPPPDAGVLRRPLIESVSVQAPALQLMATARAASETAGFAAWSESLGLLEAAPMGGWHELHRWVTDELLDAAWDRVGDVAVVRRPGALAVVDDGILTTYAEAGPDHPLARRWRTWTAAHDVAPVSHDAVARVVDMVAAAPPEALAAAGDVLNRARAEGWSWPLAMHDACWAIQLTGRTHAAAVGQLHGLRALLTSGARTPRPDVVAAVVAAIHATTAADLLASDTVAAMCRPLLGQLG
jgi:hypothetical protein